MSELDEAVKLISGVRARLASPDHTEAILQASERRAAYEDLGAALNRISEYEDEHAKDKMISEVAKHYDPAVQGDELHVWWMNLAESEVAPMIAKALEYGGMGRAVDLIEIGRALMQSGVKRVRPDQQVHDGWTGSEAEQMELGIYFYLVGKFARWQAAVAEGRQVSDDTLHDIGIYVRMAQRIRTIGGWPA